MKRKIIIIALIFLVIFSFFSIRAALAFKKAINSTQKISEAAKNQDLEAAKVHIKEAKKDFQTANRSLVVFTPIRIIPLIGWYVADAQRISTAAVSGMDAAETLTEAITPYADVLGFKGNGDFLGGTAQERLAKAIETLSKITPQLDEVGKDLTKASVEVNKIQSWRYPNILPGNPGEKIDAAKKALNQVDSFITDSKPLIEVLPQIMGQNNEQKYLVLFQNDKELRPTGGFLTAYAVFRVNKGNIASEGSQDIYQLDSTLLKKTTAPDYIQKYLKVGNLNLRDSNLSPDFKASMSQFEELYDYTQGKKEVNGIIALDTHFVLDLVKVLGPVEAYGTKFTTDNVKECECPQIIWELEKYADQPVAYERGSRKDIIGVLMQQIMDKAFNAPKSKWPSLMEVALTNLREKHLLLYFHDEKSQEAAEKVNFAGRLHEYEGDYLHINESNLGGAKSNLYIQEKVKQIIKKDGNQIKKTLTIDYKYPRKMDNCNLERKGGLCLAGIYQDFIRIYVPKGSKLIKGTGAEVPFVSKEEYNKTVFEAFFTVRPEGTAKLELEYTVPINPQGQYKLLIQKQGGVEGHSYEIEAYGKKQKAFPLITDKEILVKI